MRRLTTKQVSDLLGVDLWRIQRIYELNVIPEPEWFGGKRAIPSTDIPVIVDALRKRGWMPQAMEMASV